MTPPLIRRMWHTKTALLTHLGEAGIPSVVVGLDAEAPQLYCSFIVGTGDPGWEIGVIASGHGVDVAAVLLDEGRRFLLGHDTSLTWIDLESFALIASQPLGGVFYRFFPADRSDDVIVIHELGALRVDASGTVQWSVDSDVVEDSTIDHNGNLLLRVLDGPALTIALASGILQQ